MSLATMPGLTSSELQKLTRGMRPAEKALYLRRHGFVPEYDRELGAMAVPALSHPGVKRPIFVRFEGMRPVHYCPTCEARGACWHIFSYLICLNGAAPEHDEPVPWVVDSQPRVREAAHPCP